MGDWLWDKRCPFPPPPPQRSTHWDSHDRWHGALAAGVEILLDVGEGQSAGDVGKAAGCGVRGIWRKQGDAYIHCCCTRGIVLGMLSWIDCYPPLAETEA